MQKFRRNFGCDLGYLLLVTARNQRDGFNRQVNVIEVVVSIQKGCDVVQNHGDGLKQKFLVFAFSLIFQNSLDGNKFDRHIALLLAKPGCHVQDLSDQLLVI